MVHVSLRQEVRASADAVWDLVGHPESAASWSGVERCDVEGHGPGCVRTLELIGDELTNKHVAALNTVEATLEAKRLDEEQMVAWMHAINHLRLVIGTRLDVDEDTEYEDYVANNERSVSSS